METAEMVATMGRRGVGCIEDAVVVCDGCACVEGLEELRRTGEKSCTHVLIVRAVAGSTSRDLNQGVEQAQRMAGSCIFVENYMCSESQAVCHLGGFSRVSSVFRLSVLSR